MSPASSHLPVGVPALRSELTDDERAQVSRRLHQGHAIVAAIVVGVGAFLVPLVAAGRSDAVLVHDPSPPALPPHWQLCRAYERGSYNWHNRAFYRGAVVDCADNAVVDCVASCADTGSEDGTWRVCSSGCAAGDLGDTLVDGWPWWERSEHGFPLPGNPFSLAKDAPFELQFLARRPARSLNAPVGGPAVVDVDAELRPDATVGDVNAALIAAHAGLSRFVPGDPHVRVAVPSPYVTAAGVAAALRASRAFAYVTPPR